MFITQAETTYQKAHFGHTGPVYTHLPPRPRVSRAPPRGYALACIFALATAKTCRYSPLLLRSRYIVSFYCVVFNYFLFVLLSYSCCDCEIRTSQNLTYWAKVFNRSLHNAGVMRHLASKKSALPSRVRARADAHYMGKFAVWHCGENMVIIRRCQFDDVALW